MTRILVILLFIPFLINAQVDWEKWKPENRIYQLPENPKRDYSIDNSNLGTMVLTGVIDLYWITISDVDGDNCPFHPSCSTFFVKAVKKSNLIKGALMFADRFTRDSNFFKSKHHYKIDETGRFYDPVDNYLLEKNKIVFIDTYGDK